MGESTTYDAAVDIRAVPARPEELISAQEAAQEAVTVRCRVAARLVAVGDGINIAPADEALEGDWIYQRFTELGVVEWAWSVSPLAPGQQQLRLELRPAAEGDDVVQVASSATARYVTTVTVRASALQRVWYWFQTDWKLLAAIVGVLGAATLGLLQFSTSFRESLDKAVRRPAPATVPPKATVSKGQNGGKDAKRPSPRKSRAAQRR